MAEARCRRLAWAATALAALAVLGSSWVHVAASLTAGPLLPGGAESYSSEEAALEVFRSAAVGAQDLELPLDKEAGFEELGGAMQRGFWALAEEIVTTYRERGIDLSSRVYQSAATIRKRLQGLQDSLNKRTLVKGIPPAFQWAQSPDSVFLNVKFSHKWDTPATLGCEAENVSMEASRLAFTAACKETKKKFELELHLHGAVDTANSSWSMASVGRAMFTLRKTQLGPWTRLLKGKNKPGNMHVWWAMKERFQKENDDFGKNATTPSTTPSPNAASTGSTGSTAASSTSSSAASTSTSTSASTSAATGTDAEDVRVVEDDVDADVGLAPTPGTAGSAGADESTLSDAEKAVRAARRVLEEEAATRRKALDAETREEMQAIDVRARTRKNEIDTKARADKAAVDHESSEARTAVHERVKQRKAEIDRELRAKIAELTARTDL